MPPTHADKFVSRYLERVQNNPKARRAVATGLVLSVLGVAGYFLYGLLPHHASLTITANEILGNRHYVAKVLQEEAAPTGITLRIKPTQGSFEALELVDSHQLDLALIQGGLDNHFPNIRHVATLAPELLHFLVRPEIHQVQDIKGRAVNLGSKSNGTRVIAKQVLALSGLDDGVDYVETNRSAEELISMRPDKLPDVIVNISFVPSYLADFLVKERGYKVLEIPFPDSLAIRLGWVADGKILGYMYSVAPPVPPTDIKTIGVSLHLVAHKDVDPWALGKLLEVLYGPSVESRLRLHLDERTVAVPSGFPLSPATLTFINRANPMLSARTFERLRDSFGLIMTLLSAGIVLTRWLRGQQSTEDKRFKGFVKEVADIEKRVRELDGTGPGAAGPRSVPAALRALEQRLSAVKEQALREYPPGLFADNSVVDKLLAAITDSRLYLGTVLARAEAAPAARRPEPVA